MKLTANMKRILSALLVFVLVFSAIPFSASAANTGRTADTIFFATDRHEESSKLNSLLKALAYEPGLVVLGGDHVNNTNSGSLASITSEIHSVYPNADTFFTYAAHDPNVTPDSSNPYAYANTGEVYEGDQYYVYGVDQGDMQSSSSAATASANFVNWAASADSDKVIFVMCHMPIHNRRGDNAGGATWMNALNKAGADRDIVFLWGHNHTGESSADTSVYFVNVGGSLTPQGGSTGTINFTYMNAGYIKNGYASQIVVNSDCVDVTRYNTSGSATATYSIERRFATSHTWEVTETVAATCTADGYTVTVCTDCGETKTAVVAATGHDYDSEVKNTCTGSSTVYTCATCGHSYAEQNATETTYEKASSLTDGESYVIVASNYALTYGSSAGKTSVSVSNNEITSDVKDTMIWTYENGMLYNDSTGSAKYINLSGSSSRRTITFSTSGASVSYSSSKLKIGSYYLYHSSSSGFSARSSGSTVTLYQVNEAMGGTGEHIYESVTVDATCTQDGSKVYTCTACGDTYSEVIPANGEHAYETVVVEADCTTEGSKTHTCTVCGDSSTEVIPAIGHTYTANTTEATCNQDGMIVYICVCGDTYSEVIAATGKHTYETVTVDADCTTNGSKTYTCTACGNTYVEVIPATGHSYTAKVTAPTCMVVGYTTYTCACGDTYTADEVAATGHSYSAKTTAASCVAEGKTVYTCVCGDTYTEVIPATGKHVYEAVMVTPSCTVDGYTTYTCACGDTYTEVIPATGHSYTAKVTAPTCETAGYTTYTCAGGESYTADEVAALGHSYTAKVTAPTCEKAGYTTYTCACGESYTADEVAATGHSYSAKVTAPTCEKAGYTTYTCACGSTYTADQVAALGHDYDAVVTAPTCETAGYTTYTCSACGDTYTGNQVAATGHSYTSAEVDGYMVYTCACGHSYSEKLTVELSYEKVTSLSSGNSYVITLTSGSKYYALSHANNTISAKQVTVSNGVITSEITEDLVWDYSGNVLSYENNGTTYYLYAKSSGWWGTPTLSISSSNSTTVSFSSNKVKLGSYYLRYSSSKISPNRSGSTATLFKEIEK